MILLHTLNGLSFVLKNVLDKAKITAVSSSNVMVDGNEDALIIDVSVNGESKEIFLYGGKGYKGSDEVFAINNLNAFKYPSFSKLG